MDRKNNHWEKKNIVRKTLVQSEGHFLRKSKDKRTLVVVIDLMFKSRFSSSLSLATNPSTVTIAERSFQLRSATRYFRLFMATHAITT